MSEVQPERLKLAAICFSHKQNVINRQETNPRKLASGSAQSQPTHQAGQAQT